MNPKPKPPSPSTKTSSKKEVSKSSKSFPQSSDIGRTIVDEINQLNKFSEYGIRQMVNHASAFGRSLNQKKLKTNQIRKFLDAINRVKAQLIEVSAGDNTKALPSEIEDKIVLMKPKLAYAAARQEAAVPLSNVMSAAIDKTSDKDDFNRLVQFIESIIAYHKAEGGE